MASRPVTPEQFWARVRIGPVSECWLWTGSRHPQGYGQFSRGGKTTRASRHAWELTHGPVPSGLWVLHHCDNPPCCNPAHLFLGTVRDNTNDKVAKGRHARGESSGAAMLTEDQVQEIRSLSAAGARQIELAGIYGVHQGTISSIVRGRIWKHAPGPVRPSKDEIPEDQRAAVMAGLAGGESQRSLAARLGVDRYRIRRIARDAQ